MLLVPPLPHHEGHMDTQPAVSHVFVGLDAIGEQFRRNRRTIRRWIDTEGFPAACLPDGTWVTSKSLIDSWLSARIED